MHDRCLEDEWEGSVTWAAGAGMRVVQSTHMPEEAPVTTAIPGVMVGGAILTCVWFEMVLVGEERARNGQSGIDG